MSRSPPRVSIVVPVFNEEPVIDRVLGEVAAATRGWNVEVLVADDGSTDGTRAIVDAWCGRDARLRLVPHPSNRGKAAAIRSALFHARGDLVLIQDADLEYSPADYGALLAPFSDPEVQAVYGSRFLRRAWPDRMAAPNWIANKVFVAVTNLLFRSALTDEGTAYKAFRREALQAAGVESSGFEFCPEITAKLLRRGARIVEVPVAYSARTRRDGKKPGFRDGFAVLWTLVKYRLNG